MSKPTKIKLSVVGLILLSFITIGASCTQTSDPQAQKKIKEKITLNYWRVYDGEDAFEDIIKSYRVQRPNITINYRLLTWAEYEKELVDAWAEGRGPDIFSIHNTWVYKYQNKILPLPDQIKIALLVKGGQNPEAAFSNYKTISADTIKDYFPSVVYGDVVINGKIYGLPLSIDTLSLYYNQNLLDAAGITSPPVTWEEVAQISKNITKQDADGNLAISSIAMGGAHNINRATDILSLLMLQNGTQMTIGKKAVFNQKTPYSESDRYPGWEALRFYTDFAKISKEVYTWNEDLPEAQELFLQGKLAMMMGYSYQLPLLKSQGPKLNIRITKIPHISSDGTDALKQPINYANYWVETVFKNTPYPNEAWDFVNFMTTKQAEAKKYINKTHKPAALRTIISEQLNDPELGPFASQILTAQTWYHGSQPELLEDLFKEMIEQVTILNVPIKDAIKFGVDRVNQIL